MGNLGNDYQTTCMICSIDLMDYDLLMETNETINVVVVSDASSYPYKRPFRAVYCNACWDELAARAWQLRLMHGESKGDWSKEIAQ